METLNPIKVKQYLSRYSSLRQLTDYCLLMIHIPRLRFTSLRVII